LTAEAALAISHGRYLSLLLCVALTGCGEKPNPDSGTGAKETVQSYFEAIIQQDWERAYSFLDPECRARWHQARFAQLTQNYRNIASNPAAVKVRSCEEHGNDGVAHVYLVGEAGTNHRYRDAVALRRTEEGWKIILPPDFGRTRD
jgi:hypothetical protein